MFQTVNMQFGDGDDGPTAVLTMNAFTRNLSRKTVVSGYDQVKSNIKNLQCSPYICSNNLDMYWICLLSTGFPGLPCLFFNSGPRLTIFVI
jgi:hypothetical protein